MVSNVITFILIENIGLFQMMIILKLYYREMSLWKIDMKRTTSGNNIYGFLIYSQIIIYSI